jgi:YVTN family beta-propeller protein
MVSRYLRNALCSVALVGLAATSAVSATMDYLGTWSNTTTYATGSVIVYNKGIFYSLKSTKAAPNRNFIPSSNPTWWAPVGTVGNTILSGVVNPTSPTLGQVGDYYINTATNTMFGPKAVNGWSAVGVSLVGAKGDSGATGLQGPQGIAGAQGPAGPQGNAGAKGDTGAQGPPGIPGTATLTNLVQKTWTGKRDYAVGSATSYGPTAILFDGRYIWVGSHNGQSVTKMDPTYGTIIGSYSTPGLVGDIVFDGENIWASNWGTNTVTKFRAYDGTIIGTYSVDGGWAHDLEFDGTYVYVTVPTANKITKLDAETGAIVGSFSSGGLNPYTITYDGSHLWVTHEYSEVVKMTVTGTIVQTVANASGMGGAAFDGAYIWTSQFSSNQVAKISVVDGSVVGSYTVGSRPHGIVTDGVYVYVANESSNTVSVLRSSDGALVKTVSVGSTPVDVAFDGASIWTANLQAGTASRR